MFFTFTALPAGEYTTGWDTYPGNWRGNLWVEDDDDPFYPPEFTFNAVENVALEGLIAYADYNTQGLTLPAGLERPAHRLDGMLQVELHLDQELDFTKDNLLVAEAVPANPHVNAKAWNYIVPEHINAEGVAYYRLGYLYDGDYRLSIVQLGVDNSVEPVQLAVSDELFTVEYPHAEPVPDSIWNPDAPYAEVAWQPVLDQQ
jgi:hypothetical protein